MTIDDDVKPPVYISWRCLRTVVGVLVLLVLAIVIVDAYLWFTRTRFDSSIWRAATNNDPVRIEMVDDLMSQYDLVGMTRADVDKLLGIPPSTSYFSEFDYVYWLGPERGYISIDSEWLCLKFRREKVVEAEVMSD